MSLTLTYQDSATVPVEVEGITPERVRDLTISQIEKLEVFHGNESASLADFFRVAGDPCDGRIEWHGSLTGVHWIGAKMKSGSVIVHGDAGRHVGSEMSGGEIHVRGDVGDWLGGEMHGGMIRVDGRAAHLVGAAYRGSRRGMTGGTILVNGDVGNELGHTMRRGIIAVAGNAGDLIGFNMLAGTIVVFGDVGIRHGAGMRRGTIALLGPNRPDILPSFRSGGPVDSVAFTLLLREFDRLGFAYPRENISLPFEMVHGDLIEGGKGELLLPAA